MSLNVCLYILRYSVFHQRNLIYLIINLLLKIQKNNDKYPRCILGTTNVGYFIKLFITKNVRAVNSFEANSKAAVLTKKVS